MGRAGKIAAGVAGAIVLGLGLAQLFLPSIVASRITSRLRRYGPIESVSVQAWPAVKLLWGQADSVTVRARSVKVSPAQTAKLVREARGTGDLHLSAISVLEGRLRLHEVSLEKRGELLAAAGTATKADVRAALPAGFDVQLLRSGEGQVVVRASGGLFGVGASLDAVAEARGGRLVAHPLGVLLERLQITLFADPHVYVEAVGASQTAGSGVGPGYRLTIRARMR